MVISTPIHLRFIAACSNVAAVVSGCSPLRRGRETFYERGRQQEHCPPFFEAALDGEPNLAVVDDVLAPEHVLRGPKLGTEEVEGVEEFKSELVSHAGGRCIIERQIAEDDWVATIYTLREANQDSMGVMVSRIADGKIQESIVIARSLLDLELEQKMRTIVN